MRVAQFAFIAVALSACVEYDIQAPLTVNGEPNAPTLESPVVEDRIVQVTTPEVDILWTIDNSGSMADEQQALTDNFPVFMQYFLGSGLDYHIGVISTDNNAANHQGNLREADGVRFIDEETPSPATVFTQMASLGINGSSNESGRATTYKAIELKKDDYNAGFVRESAALHIIVISDEDDHSGNNPISMVEFGQYLVGLKDFPDMVTFSSIVRPPNGMGGIFEIDTGTQYIEVTNFVGGILHDIANDDWGVVLEDLGVQASGLKHEFFLSELPVPATIAVTVEEDGSTFEFVEGDDWTYSSSRNSIVFVSYVPNALSTVDINYTALSSL